MITKRAVTAASSAEFQALRQQWMRSGKCVRCFHASLRSRAENGSSEERSRSSPEGNDQETPYNKPQRGPTRHQRSAMISEEVRLLKRDTPALGPSKTRHDDTDFAVGPQSLSDEERPGRMGENMPPEREGPFAQGVGREIRSYDDEDVGGNTAQVRGVRSPKSAVEEPTKGGASVMQPDPPNDYGFVEERRARPEEEEQDQDDEDGEGEGDYDGPPDVVTQSRQPAPTARGRSIQAPGVPFQPLQISKDELLLRGSNTSTIASANFTGVLEDRIRSVAEPGRSEIYRSIPYQAQRLLRNGEQLLRFESEEEKNAVIAECGRLTGRGAKMTDQERAAKGADNYEPFKPLPETSRKSVVQKNVNGVYDADGLLAGKAKHKQPLLDQIARAHMRNSTYLSSDSDRSLAKVRSLLPATHGVQQQARGGGQQRASK